MDQRVPKKLLLENGAPTAADKRIINDGVEELLWLAALKPTTIGVPEYRDDVREYLEVAVLVEKDDAERVYFVVETKGGLFTDDLRGTEGAKIKCGEAHFQTLAVGENPARYIVATKIDDLIACW